MVMSGAEGAVVSVAFARQRGNGFCKQFERILVVVAEGIFEFM